jgi:SAM-dependent methyltransferase
MESTAPILFDHAARRKHVARHAARLTEHDFLWREGAELLGESLDAITHRFANVVELNARTPHLTELLRARAGTEQVRMLHIENETLGLADDSVDAMLSNLSLHTINDLPGILVQASRALKPDGLFLTTLPGAQTLHELRQVLAETEVAMSGGISPRVAPFIDVRDAGNLLSRAGFALPVTDSITLPVTYSSLFALMDDLRGAGEANMLRDRRKTFTRRDFFVQAAARYAAQHSDREGRITATAEIITLTAWKPAPNQQQPARRGSGKVSLHKIF